jgi:dipeptidyl aminopeptidase/acylaminoacyl peptidase
MKKLILFVLLSLTFASCSSSAIEAPTASLPTVQIAPTLTPFRPAQQVTLAPSITPFPTATEPGADSPYPIPALRQRTYGGERIEPVYEQARGHALSRVLVQYPSDGLNIYARVSIPDGEGPFPVIIAIHGYVSENTYADQNYIIDEFDGLAQAGYIVIIPNMRNYPLSDYGDNRYRVGMSIDILNLIEIVKSQAGEPGILENADASRLGLWAHSMGGEIALRVLTISPDIDAALLYAPLGGDTLENSQILYRLTPIASLEEEINTPQYLLTVISPMNYFTHINAAIRLFHGSDDSIVPVTISVKTCDSLEKLSKNIECTFVPDQGHTFRSSYSPTFGQEISIFYETYLKNAQ